MPSSNFDGVADQGLIKGQTFYPLVRASQVMNILRFLIDEWAGLRFRGGVHGIATTEDEMIELGRSAAAAARPGMVIALVGGLGVGKTHWSKGFVAGLGASVEVTSPTFGLVHEYHGGRLPVYHFDFYRLRHGDELVALGWDEYLDAGGVVIVEWADKFADLLPATACWLEIGIGEDQAHYVRDRIC